MAILGGSPKLIYYPRNLTSTGEGTGAQFKIEVDPVLNQYIVKNISSGEPTEGVANFSGNGVVNGGAGGRRSGTSEFIGMGKFVPDMSGNQGTITGNGNAMVKFVDGSIVSMLGSFEGKATLAKGFLTGRIQFSGTSPYGDLFTGTAVIEGTTTAKEAIISATGTEYKKKDIILIPGTSLGGLSPDNDLTLTVTDVNKDGGILQTLVSGECKLVYDEIKGSVESGGSDALFNVSKKKNSYSVKIKKPGKNYSVGEVITISGSFLGGETNNDLKFIVVEVNVNGGILSTSTSDNDIPVEDEEENGEGLSIISAIIVDSGVGYLPKPDGSLGGAGSVFSKPNQTILFNDDDGYSVFDPNSTIQVKKGDLIGLPPATIIEIYDKEGEVLQVVQGEGQLEMKQISDYGTLTTPAYTSPENVQVYPTNQEGSYPVVLYIKDIAILNNGANYSKNDKIVVNPDRGAVLIPKYGNFGTLESVEIQNGGLGFDEIPNIFIKSETGINALIVPIFGVIRVGDLPEDQDIIPPGTPLVSVVDCVGRV